MWVGVQEGALLSSPLALPIYSSWDQTLLNSRKTSLLTVWAVVGAMQMLCWSESI